MSAPAAEESQKAKKQCVVFEPQAWRKTLCRNCFKSKDEHTDSGDADDPQKKPTSPVVSDGDAVVLRREGTPLKDRSRSATPTFNSTTTNATPTTKDKENDSTTNDDAQSDKEKDKRNNKTCPGVDKSSSLGKNTTNKVQTNSEKSKCAKTDVTDGEDELQNADRRSTADLNDGKTSNEEDSKQVPVQKPAAATLSQSAENSNAGNALDVQDDTEAPTISESADIKSQSNEDTSVSPAAVKPPCGADSSPAQSGHHGNASSPQVGQTDVEATDDTPGRTINTDGPAGDEDGSNSSTITGCTRVDDTAASAAAAAAAAGVATSRSSGTSDEIIGNAATTSAEADDTKIDHGCRGKLQSANSAAAGQEVEAPVADGSSSSSRVEKSAGHGEDSQPVCQLEPTPPDQRVDAGVPSVQSGLFTNEDVVVNSSSGAQTTSASSIFLATAAADQLSAGGSSVKQLSQDLRVDIGGSAATGNDFVPEVTSSDSAAGHAKVEATITLSGGSSLPYVVDNSNRPIHVVSAAGISGYQRAGGSGVAGTWSSAAESQNVDDIADRGRLPPDYEQSASGCSPSDESVVDDPYGPTSPLVEYLSRSPLARSLHGAVERSPEAEIVATGGGGDGGETSLFHHVPESAADGDEAVAAADWEAGHSRDGGAARLAANSDTDYRLNTTTVSVLLIAKIRTTVVKFELLIIKLKKVLKFSKKIKVSRSSKMFERQSESSSDYRSVLP